MGLVEVFDEPARKVVVALIVVIKDAEDVQQRGLAGARRAHDGNELAVLYVEADSFQHMERVGRAEVVGLMDVFEMKHGLFDNLTIYYLTIAMRRIIVQS